MQWSGRIDFPLPIPHPQLGEAPTTKRISPPDDPPSGDNPTSGDDPTSGEDCGDGDDGEEEEPADEPMSKAEFMELIQEACSDIPGLTSPDDPDDYKNFYQASVRASLNAVASFPIQRDVGAGSNDSAHPQLTNPVDGFIEAVVNEETGQLVPGLVSGILEVKFSEDPGGSGSIKGNQYRRHFEDLARADQLAGVPIRNSQLYLLVTLSSFDNLQSLGSSYRYNDILDEASGKDISVLHARLVREGGEYYLEGEPLSRNTGVQIGNWLADISDVNQVSFVVSCTPED